MIHSPAMPPIARRLLFAALGLALLPLAWSLSAHAEPRAENRPPEAEKPAAAEHQEATLTIEGRVVWLADALKRRHDINTVPEANQYVLALETKTGDLYPLVEDTRGRAFRRDERLRKMQVRLLVRRFPGVPNVQIVRMWNRRDDGLFEVDYWCEICAIAMFELKACDCCQGPIHLRQRPVDPQTGETAKTGELEESPPQPM